MRQVFQVILGLCFFALAFHKGDVLSQLDPSKAKDLPLVTLKRQYVDMATLGYRAAWDRIILIWTLQQGEALTGVASSNEIFRIYLNAAKLKPSSHHLYIYGCSATGFRSKNWRECIDILKIGVEVFPDSWQMWTFLGLSYFFTHDDQNAAMSFRNASLKPNAPSYLGGVYNKFITSGLLDPTDAVDTLNKTLNDSSLSRLRDRLLKENTPK